MAVSMGSKVVQFTADNDTKNFGGQKIRLKGARLIAAAATATAQVRMTDSSGDIIYSLTCVANTADESNISTTLDVSLVHVDLSGAGAILYLYVE